MQNPKSRRVFAPGRRRAKSRKPEQNSQIERLEPRALLSVALTTTVLTESLSSSAVGQSVTLTAKVATKSGKPTGTVTFRSGSTTVGTASLNSSQSATVAVTTLAVGTDALTATYGGTSSFAGSTSPKVSHVVTAALTKTSITESTSSSLLGQTVNVTVTVADVSPAVGTPSGTVTLYDGKTALGTQTLSGGKYTGSLPVLFVGSHSLSAVYAGSTNALGSSSAAVTLSVKLPTMTKASDGLQVGTISAGTGAGAVDGQSLHMNYIGFLQNGTVFDSSVQAGRSPFDFTLGAGQVIAGWDQGMVGIKVGEQRVLVIPPALGYGAAGQGTIPGNATLTFLVQLLSFNVPKLNVTSASGVAVSYNETPTTSNGTILASVKVGQTGSAASFIITNTGALALNFTSATPVEISGADATDFVITQPAIANNQAVFTVTFKPKATGLRKATITLLTNDPTHPQFTFNVQGTGM
jgi:hypothetical protein